VLYPRRALCWTRGGPAARPEGLGATVAGAIRAPWTVLTLCAAAGLATLAPGLPWWRGPLAVAAAVAAAGLVVWRCTNRLGGITGDVLGACVETAAAAAWLALAP
jgi:adenosylcobinamide-GDP ribazoletransferase